MSDFYVPSVNLIGCGVVNEIGSHIRELGYNKALLVTDHYIAGSDILSFLENVYIFILAPLAVLTRTRN